MSFTLKYAVRSDRGLVRGNNEDSVYAGPRLLAIADGMGGHAAGEVASKIVIGAVEELDEDRPIADLIGALRSTVDDATAALAHAVEENRALEGMGTTLTAIRFAGSRIALVHVGDSRAYLMRGGQLSQITHDDTYVQSLVDSGKLTAEEASHHPRRSMILRALNGTEVDPDISIREARKGDRYLLCSDGLSDVVTATTLLEALSSGTPQNCADRLIELALRGGGPDNVTCIVADVVDLSDGDDLPIVGGAVSDQAEVTETQADTPAGRAARISRPLRPAPVVLVGRRSRRSLLVGLLLGLIVIGAAITGYSWTQKQYFVGKDGNEVAVFRGVNAHFGPVSLYSVIENSDLRVSDLTQSASGQVSNGITANSRSDAEAILARLAGQLKPLCPAAITQSPTPTPVSTPKSTPKTTPKTSAKPSGTAKKSTATRSSASALPTPSALPSGAFSSAPSLPDCR
ncbi:MAG: protein phosphatase 2C domain-containing protein [Actinomycetota bacterium]|nr:protein phosphatase 2C domain-containing protein [Actinomycetota bacterium]MDQ2955461.1 protein phosphatase 2C domain-containing protein [Actinomycetota bacterium]